MMKQKNSNSRKLSYYLSNPISPYGIAKLTVENYLKFYKENFNLNFVSLRFPNVFGSRQNPQGKAEV